MTKILFVCHGSRRGEFGDGCFGVNRGKSVKKSRGVYGFTTIEAAKISVRK